MLKLLRLRQIDTPEPTADREILIAGERIAALGTDITVPQGWPVEVIDLPEGHAVPGFIDQHAHITGGGGEGGCATRCPPITVPEIVRAGVTTVVGVLGTDSVSRSPADLLAKARSLQAEGVTAYMYTGAYRVPPPTLTGDVQRDLAWVPDVIGVGEIAISDHRSSQPSDAEIARIVSDASVGGMLGNKLGICHFHVGAGQRGLAPLRNLLRETEIAARQVIPTHVNRDRRLLQEAAEYALEFEAMVDVTAFEDPEDHGLGAADAVHYLLDAGVPAGRITISSDCNGSMPVFDERGQLVALEVATNRALLGDWQALARSGRLSFAESLALVTSNVAGVLGVEDRKGSLAPGRDADITVLDPELNPVAVFGRGQRLL